MKFYGHAHRTLDEKGRLILPPKFRDLILENVPEGYIVLTIYGNRIIGITPTQWEHLVSELEAIKVPSPDMEETMILVYAGYTEVPVNKQGRIAIPANLRKSGKLGTNVSVMGAGGRFEIRPEDSFDDLMSKPRNISAELAENNANLGIF